MLHRVIVSLNLRRRSNVVQRWPLDQSTGFHVQPTKALCWETTMDILQGPYEWPWYKRKVKAWPYGVHFVAGLLCSVGYVGLGGVGRWHWKLWHSHETFLAYELMTNDLFSIWKFNIGPFRWRESIAYLLNIILKTQSLERRSKAAFMSLTWILCFFSTN